VGSNPAFHLHFSELPEGPIGKNDPSVIISCGKIDPNGSVSEAWILHLKHGRWIAWGAKNGSFLMHSAFGCGEKASAS
jgi:hypothetical protein